MSAIHIRHIRRTLEDQFTAHVDVSDWDGRPDDQREAAFLSRALAAFALAELAEVDPATAAAAITDGGGDNGLDGILFDRDNRHLLIVQSKWDDDGGGSPSVAGVQKLIQGFTDLTNGRFEVFNAQVRTLQPTIMAALDDPNVTFEIIFAHTGQAALADEPRRLLDDLMAEMNDTSDVVSYRVLDQGALHRLVQGRLEGDAINLEVTLQDWGRVQEPYKAFYGQVPAADVARWWEDHGARLLSKNLRKFLPDSDVNDAIVNTLLSEPSKFWYFNNGITVLCERLQKKPLGGNDRANGYFVCEGVTVVNGAQTVGSIGTAHVKDPARVEQARVTARFISLEDVPEGFAPEVTRATNTQNRVERRDFVSLDPEQERIRTELQLENGKTYVIKTGDPDPSPQAGCSVVEATVALACALPDPAVAVQAKREIGRLWEDLTKAPYKQIFNPSVSGLRVWRAVALMRGVDAQLKVEQGRREGRARAVAVHGNRLILHLVFQRLANGSLGDPQVDFDALKAKIASTTTEVLDLVSAEVESQFASNYIASLFKNATKCKALVAGIAAPATSSATATSGSA